MPSEQFKRFANESRKFIKSQKGKVRRLVAERDGKEEPVTDSTFLVIPAFDGDSGVRPVPDGIPAWHSPAVNVISPSADPNTPLEVSQGRLSPHLIAGQTYIFEAWVQNRGDMAAPAVNVEFFKRLPGMGATAENAIQLGATSISIGRNDKARATLEYTASVEDAGHWCLHVRASSFNPPDFPSDWSSLSARHHRHVGQQNITVVLASSQMLMVVSPLNIGRTKSRAMRIRVISEAPPRHLITDKCLTETLRLRKGLKSSKFELKADFSFRKTARKPNSWDMKLAKGQSHQVMLQLPPHRGSDVSTRVYSVEAYDIQGGGAPVLVDGVTLLIQKE